MDVEIFEESIEDLLLDVHRVPTPDGSIVALSHLKPSARAEKQTAPGVVLAHGVFVNRGIWLSRRGQGFATWLSQCGYDVWMLEMREHGRARQKGIRQRQVNFKTYLKNDVPTALQYVLRQTGQPSLFWIGHSHGGTVMYGYLARNPAEAVKLRGLVTLGTQTTEQNRTMKDRLRLAIGSKLDRFLGYFPARNLRLGSEDEFAGIMGDWIRWNQTGQWVDDGFDYYRGLQRVYVPLFVLAGAGDDMAGVYGCRRIYEAAGSPDKQFLELGTQNSHLLDYDHTTILIGLEAEREVWPVILKWLELH